MIGYLYTIVVAKMWGCGTRMFDENDKKRGLMSSANKWFNAIADAWNAGNAPWAYPDGTSEAVRVWNRAFFAAGGESLPEGFDQRREWVKRMQPVFSMADNAVISWATALGVRLKK